MSVQPKPETLTVSFGTFSCTLEGAENPVEMMMAVTEFFRDMVENDRHFGAEPPMVEHDAIEPRRPSYMIAHSA